MITVYTDGSCLKIQWSGWMGFLVLGLDNKWEVSGGNPSTTNNRMELEAVIQTLEFLSNTTDIIHIYTDSKYVINGITEWIYNWIRKEWKNVKNSDLWKKLYKLNHNKVEWKWVKGHSGNIYNDRVDKLAKIEAEYFI